jgi:stage V sporulation protein R
MGGLPQREGSLPPHLAAQARRIEDLARQEGLDFFGLRFQLLDARDVNGVAAYGGFPVRYPSWRHGMEFERLEKGYSWGLSKIYELVINTDPVVAYLVRSNSDLEQKLVMAHVCGHADFFKHNCWYAATDRGMLDTMARHATLVRRHIDRQGLEPVERFLDQVLSLENLIDPYLPLRARLRGGAPDERGELGYDLLGFLAERAPLVGWQRDLVRIVRAEAHYFQPQRMTRIMNEGWASFWHSRLLTAGVLDDSEIVDFADCHAGATQQAPGRLNPYKLGIELWRFAEQRGEDLFRLRRVHNDASFVDELVDESFVQAAQLFLFAPDPRSGRSEVQAGDWREVKARLLQDLAWGGLPRIELVSDDADGGGELFLQHHHDGRDLDLAQAGATLERLEAIWGAAVQLATREGDQRRLLTCRDGLVEVRAPDEADDAPEGEPAGS